MARREELSNEQWAVIEPHLPKAIIRVDGKGCPRRSDHEIMNGILWILRSGARWKDPTDRFPSYQTCHRRFQEWVKSGALREILEALIQDLKDRDQFDLSECYINATFVVAKKGDTELKKPSGAGYKAYGSGKRL